MDSKDIDRVSDLVACIFHLKEASRCIEEKLPDLSLAILETAKAVADIACREDQDTEASLKEFESTIDEIREAE